VVNSLSKENNMEVQAVEKYIRISPKKARLVADIVRNEKAVNALAMLRFMPKKAAKIIFKALTSAVANATNNAGLDKDALIVSKITIDKGPSLKRFRPRSRGMASALLKRTSHITVVVSADKAKKKEEAK
jgi:large subunit ribosomal protein L22